MFAFSTAHYSRILTPNAITSQPNLQQCNNLHKPLSRRQHLSHWPPSSTSTTSNTSALLLRIACPHHYTEQVAYVAQYTAKQIALAHTCPLSHCLRNSQLTPIHHHVTPSSLPPPHARHHPPRQLRRPQQPVDQHPHHPPQSRAQHHRADAVPPGKAQCLH